MKEKLPKIIHNIYREMYENSDPPGDFDELMSACESAVKMVVDIGGDPYIDTPYECNFHDRYILSEIKQDEIIDRHIKKLSGLEKRIVIQTVVLGASPRYEK